MLQGLVSPPSSNTLHHHAQQLLPLHAPSASPLASGRPSWSPARPLHAPLRAYDRSDLFAINSMEQYFNEMDRQFDQMEEQASSRAMCVMQHVSTACLQALMHVPCTL